jgi:hypothetical protein
MSVSHFDYALLCNALYFLPEEIQAKADKWGLVSTFEGYFNYEALTFRYDNQIVFVHHTKVNSEIDIINNALISPQLIPIHILMAISYTYSIQAEYGIKYSYSHTGHSMGGAVAEFIALQTQTEAVSFDAPGIKDIAERFVNNTTYSVSQLTSYVSFPNIMNTVEKPLSSPIMLIGSPIVLSWETAIEDYLIYGLTHHNMNNMWEALNAQSINNMSRNWPKSFVKGYEWFINYQINHEYLDRFLERAWSINPTLAAVCNKPLPFLGHFFSIRNFFSNPIFFGESNFTEFKRYMLENELTGSSIGIPFVDDKVKALLSKIMKDKYVVKNKEGLIGVFQPYNMINIEFDNDNAEYLCSTKLNDNLSFKLCEFMGYNVSVISCDGIDCG